MKIYELSNFDISGYTDYTDIITHDEELNICSSDYNIYVKDGYSGSVLRNTINNSCYEINVSSTDYIGEDLIIDDSYLRRSFGQGFGDPVFECSNIITNDYLIMREPYGINFDETNDTRTFTRFPQYSTYDSGNNEYVNMIVDTSDYTINTIDNISFVGNYPSSSTISNANYMGGLLCTYKNNSEDNIRFSFPISKAGNEAYDLNTEPKWESGKTDNPYIISYSSSGFDLTKYGIYSLESGSVSQYVYKYYLDTDNKELYLNIYPSASIPDTLYNIASEKEALKVICSERSGVKIVYNTQYNKYCLSLLDVTNSISVIDFALDSSNNVYPSIKRLDGSTNNFSIEKVFSGPYSIFKVIDDYNANHGSLYVITYLIVITHDSSQNNMCLIIPILNNSYFDIEYVGNISGQLPYIYNDIWSAAPQKLTKKVSNFYGALDTLDFNDASLAYIPVIYTKDMSGVFVGKLYGSNISEFAIKSNNSNENKVNKISSADLSYCRRYENTSNFINYNEAYEILSGISLNAAVNGYQYLYAAPTNVKSDIVTFDPYQEILEEIPFSNYVYCETNVPVSDPSNQKKYTIPLDNSGTGLFSDIETFKIEVSGKKGLVDNNINKYFSGPSTSLTAGLEYSKVDNLEPVSGTNVFLLENHFISELYRYGLSDPKLKIKISGIPIDKSITFKFY